MKHTPIKSKIFEAVHETACDLYNSDLIDETRMREYDEECRQHLNYEYSAERIILLRKRYQLSRSVLASLLNISPGTVRKWETGENCPAGPSKKLLSILDKRGLEVFRD